MSKNSGVTLATWGTHSDLGNGLNHFFDSHLTGENVGHASLSITFPANEEGLALIKKYCINPAIPYERRIIEKKSTIVTSGAPGGPSENEQEVLEKEEVFTIYFSWWPSKDDGVVYALKPTMNNDNINERAGVDYGWSEEAKKVFNPETRNARGWAGTTTKTLSPKEIVHERDLTFEQKRFLELKSELFKVDDDLESLDVLKGKLEKEKIKIDPNFLSLVEKCISIPDITAYLATQKQIESNSSCVSSMMEEIKKRENQLLEKKAHCTSLLDAEKKRLLDLRKQEVFEEAKIFVNREKQKRTLETIKKVRNAFSTVTEVDSKHLVRELNNAMYNWNDKLKLSSESIAQLTLEDLANLEEELTNEINNSPIIDINQLSGAVKHTIKILELEEKRKKLTYVDLEKIEAIGVYKWEDNQDEIKNHVENLLPKWREFFPNESGETPIALNKERYEKLAELIKDDISQLEKQAKMMGEELKFYYLQSSLEALESEAYVTRGHRPDNIVYLPVSGVTETQNTQPGLNVENMLKQIQTIVTRGKEFDLAQNNCSTTVGSVLKAGAQDSFKAFFDRRTLGFFGNPQEVHSGALQYQTALLNGTSFVQRMAPYNPLNIVPWLGGIIIGKLIDDQKKPIAKAGYFFLGIPVAVAAGTIGVIKALFNPLNSAKQLLKFTSYANKDKNIGFRILAGCVYVPGLILTTPLAGIQYGLTQAAKGMRFIGRSLLGSKKPVFENDALTPEQIQKNEILHKVSQKVMDNMREMLVSAENPEDAFKVFGELFEKARESYEQNTFLDNKFPLISLTPETVKMLEKAIASENDPDKKAMLQKNYQQIQKNIEYILIKLNGIIKEDYKTYKPHTGSEDALVIPPIENIEFEDANSLNPDSKEIGEWLELGELQQLIQSELPKDANNNSLYKIIFKEKNNVVDFSLSCNSGKKEDKEQIVALSTLIRVTLSELMLKEKITSKEDALKQMAVNNTVGKWAKDKKLGDRGPMKILVPTKAIFQEKFITTYKENEEQYSTSQRARAMMIKQDVKKSDSAKNNKVHEKLKKPKNTA